MRNLLSLVKKFRNSTCCLRPYIFIPWHYSSQTCEELFRTTRSMTSTYSTVVNFSMNDILKRLTRIELLNLIQNDLQKNEERTINENPSNENLQNTFNFPRFNKHSRNFFNSSKLQKTSTFETMSDTEIENICTSSLRDAKEMSIRLGNSLTLSKLKYK